MSNITQITDYSKNLDLLLEQYKNSGNLKGIIDSMNDQADDLEAALFEIRDNFYLTTAEGVQLDVIGEIFGPAREGDTDAVYRAKISTRASLISSGEPENIINILINLYGATYVDFYPSWPAVPAGFYLLTDAVITLNQLLAFTGAGIQGFLMQILKYEDDTPIEFEDGSYLHIVS